MGRAYSRVHRLLRLLRLIQARGDLSADDLARELETSKRNVFRDLATLNASGVPCHHDPVTGGYRVAKGFFMPPVELTFDEALAMVVLMERLPRGSQIPFLDTAQRVVEKIRCQLPSTIREELSPLDGRVHMHLARGMADNSPGDVYEAMRHAIAKRRALSCKYESNHRNADEPAFIFKPYALWYCQRAWYVVGQRSDRPAEELRHLKLNRFTGVTKTDQPYSIPEDFNLDDHLGLAWRMIRGKKRYQVAIRFRQPFAETATETRWHPTQTEDWADDGKTVTLRFEVDGLDEIVWWVLGYGPGAEVLEPAELRGRVRTLLSDALAIYDRKKTKQRTLQ